MAGSRHVFTFEEYTAIAATSPNRVEFWEGAILDMSGGSPRHSAICSNIGGILRAQLRGTPCRSFDANLKVRAIAVNRATYADVTVVCGALEVDPADKTQQTVLNPTVLIEVLSPSTECPSRKCTRTSPITSTTSPVRRQGGTRRGEMNRPLATNAGFGPRSRH